jgi:dephospho-CoA kinase
MPTHIIGLVGRQGSGKGTVAKILQEKYGAVLFRFSAVLGDILDRVAVERSRENLIKISEALRNSFGEDVLAYAIEKDAASTDADIVVIDGIRRLEDIVALEPLEQFTLVSVHAPAELRFQRVQGRSEKPGESGVSFEDFLKVEETAPTEVTIPMVEDRAMITINNDGSLEQLQDQISTLMNDL